MAHNSLRAEVVSTLKSVLQSTKGGVSIKLLQDDYKSIVGEGIPYPKLGYMSLEDMLKDMKDAVQMKRNASNEIIVQAVADKSTAHIAKLVSKQKPSKSSIKLQSSSTRIRRSRTMSKAKHQVLNNLPSPSTKQTSKNKLSESSNKKPVVQNISDHKCLNSWRCEVCISRRSVLPKTTVEQKSLPLNSERVIKCEDTESASACYFSNGLESNHNNVNEIKQYYAKILMQKDQEIFQATSQIKVINRDLSLKNQKLLEMQEAMYANEQKVHVEINKLKIAVMSANKGLNTKHKKYINMENKFLSSEKNFQQAKADIKSLSCSLQEKEEEINILKSFLTDEENIGSVKLINEIRSLNRGMRFKNEEIKKLKQGLVASAQIASELQKERALSQNLNEDLTSKCKMEKAFCENEQKLLSELNEAKKQIALLNEEYEKALHMEKSFIANEQTLQLKLKSTNKGMQSMNRQITMKDQDIIKLKDKLQEVSENYENKLVKANQEIQSMNQRLSVKLQEIMGIENRSFKISESYEYKLMKANQEIEDQHLEIKKLRKDISILKEQKLDNHLKLMEVRSLINLHQARCHQLRYPDESGELLNNPTDTESY